MTKGVSRNWPRPLSFPSAAEWQRAESARLLRLLDQERKLAPTNAKARYNLANVLHDLKEYAAARLLFRDAVALAGQMADAHFYLALTLLELVDEATGHWGEYVALEPEGAWAAIAREHLQDRPEVQR